MTEETKTEKDIQELIDLAFSAVVQTSVELEDDQLDALENLNQYCVNAALHNPEVIKKPLKVVYKTNFNQTPRTLADNLDPSVNRVLQATPTALRLKSGEAVTQIMFIFGTVPSGFRMVDNAYIYGTVRKSASGSSFVNKADVGGLNDSQQWIMSNDAWTTTIYRAPTYKKPTLPTTGW